MDTLHTNTSSFILQSNLNKTNNAIQTSIERLSTGFRINHAKDDAANMAISKNMEAQFSGANVALDNTQQGINLLQTADDSLDNMQINLQKIRDLTVQAMNGTYSAEEKAVMQEEVNQILEEIYKQRNTTTFNQIKIFGTEETMPVINLTADSSSADTEETETPLLTSAAPLMASGGSSTSSSVGVQPVTPLTEEEAIAAGYTCIHNETEFNQIKSNTSGKYCLMADIDFSKISGWGQVILQSSGELNGNGYTIDKFTITSTSAYRNGLFSENNGTIQNVNMTNVNITSDEDDTGGLVGYNNGTVYNCSVSGSIKGGANTGEIVGYSQSGAITNCSSSGTVQGLNNSGGLVGFTYGGSLTNCSTSATVTATGQDTGGLTGNVGNSVTITNCSASGTVTGTSRIGGLIGAFKNATVTNCSATGNVSGTSDVGGLVGDSSGTIIACKSSGTVTGTDDNTGGLVGNNGGSIDTSYTTSTVNGADYTGGLVGYNDSANISNSYALGNVSGERYVGGFVGQLYEGNISTSYSTGTVTGSDAVGGFVGQNGSSSHSGNITNSYTTSSLDFYGTNRKGTISNCHGTKSQTGVTAHAAEWFEDGDNLTFLGAEYDTTKNPPDLIDNSRYEPGPDPPGPDPPGPDPPGPDPPGPDPPGPDPPTPQSTEIQFQVGAGSGAGNTITIDTGFSLNNLSVNIMTLESCETSLAAIDASLNSMAAKRSEIGSYQNRFKSVTDQLTTEKINLQSSYSTIMDTDYAEETSKLTKNQILHSINASLLAQENINQKIALRLLT